MPTVIDIASGAARSVGPDDAASRYSPAWENDSTLLVMSDASGAIEIERLPLDGGSVSVAVRTIGAAGAPEVGPDGRIWWLDLHGRGWDLRVNDAGSALPVAPVLDDTQFPAVRRVDTRLAQEFPAAPLRDPKRYGAGPFGLAFLMLGGEGADGGTWGAGATFGDPVGRSTGFAFAGASPKGSWSGARLAYTWRGFRPSIQIQGYRGEYLVSEQPSKAGLGWEPFDRRFTGAMLALELTRHGARGSANTRLGYSVGRSENPTLAGPSRDRSLYFAQLGGNLSVSPRPRSSVEFRWQATTSAGTADGGDWARHTVDTRLALAHSAGGVALRARGGEASEETPFSERFIVGGTASPFVDQLLLTNRIEHLGLPFGIAGAGLALFDPRIL
ncbi:MAG TPA: hypothetical protein PK788_07715, partial [Gemmatimonadaceae bacterium]|nr:hypothetical protein [Gemmatimonadaceae bacterium]